MPRDTFERFVQNLNLSGNEQLDKQDSKLCLVISELNKKFLKFSFNGENRFINEFINLYYGTHGSRQPRNSKIKWDIKSGSLQFYDYVVQFEQRYR